jgi:AcrR family transcriptional regulator
MPRSYAMTGRAAAMQRTREAILDAAEELFTPAWYDEVTLADVAGRAGVSLQTVVNHFGTKADLYLTGLAERYVPKVTALRDAARPGDVASVVDAVLADYEETGDGTIRTLALAGRMPELTGVVAGGRAAHAGFVERTLGSLVPERRGAARARRLRMLGIALDVRTWHQLRREQGLDVAETRAHLTTMVGALLA